MAYTWVSTLLQNLKMDFHSADFTTGVIGIAAYSLLFFLLSALVFRRQDLCG